MTWPLKGAVLSTHDSSVSLSTLSECVVFCCASGTIRVTALDKWCNLDIKFIPSE